MDVLTSVVMTSVKKHDCNFVFLCIYTHLDKLQSLCFTKPTAGCNTGSILTDPTLILVHI